jgi:alanine racemase
MVRGMRAPVRGRVTMDLTVVDVTRIPGVRIGDEAVLFGGRGRDPISAGEVAGLTGTIPYEVLCLAGGMNPRLYRGVGA